MQKFKTNPSKVIFQISQKSRKCRYTTQSLKMTNSILFAESTTIGFPPFFSSPGYGLQLGNGLTRLISSSPPISSCHPLESEKSLITFRLTIYAHIVVLVPCICVFICGLELGKTLHRKISERCKLAKIKRALGEAGDLRLTHNRVTKQPVTTSIFFHLQIVIIYIFF